MNPGSESPFTATKSPRHKAAQSIECQLYNLGESLVPWCLSGIVA
jgi:hypothetical protein